jgi:hypothetical protein
MTVDAASSSFLDSAWLRLIALVVAAAGVLLFLVTNQDFLAERFGSNDASSAYRQCLDERMGSVANMAREAGFTGKQRELAEMRAQEFCRNQSGA